jgi:hypothetical protein
MIICFTAPLLWSLVIGAAGVAIGAQKVTSPGSRFVGAALVIHFPALVVLGNISPAAPMGAGDDGGFEVMMLELVTLPSCLFYGFIGWLTAEILQMIKKSRENRL